MNWPEFNLEEQEWWSLTPVQRFRETEKLWVLYLARGGEHHAKVQNT